MTEFTDSVHILDNDMDDPPINYVCCMARKTDKTQCTHSKKMGDFCRVHGNKSNIIRIDEPILNKPKRAYIKKTRIINKTIKTNRNVNSVITIQSWFRGCLVRKANRLRGPGFYNRSLCNNSGLYCFNSFNNILYSS